MFLQGWILVQEGQAEEGLVQMEQGLAALRSTGVGAFLPRLLAWLAEAYMTVRQLEQGLAVLAEAVEIIAKTEEREYEAEVYRLKGELLLAQKGSRLQAEGYREKTEKVEECFHTAIEISRRQQAKSLELRATTSLARLWQQQNKIQDIRELLVPVYNWFTEGFDTKDLQAAKALLDELSEGR